jgi:hypothetical protein
MVILIKSPPGACPSNKARKRGHVAVGKASNRVGIISQVLLTAGLG